MGLYLLIFLAGCAWIITGMAALSALDPEGDHDDVVMGADYSIFQFGVSLLFWPFVALWLRSH